MTRDLGDGVCRDFIAPLYAEARAKEIVADLDGGERGDGVHGSCYPRRLTPADHGEQDEDRVHVQGRALDAGCEYVSL